MEKFTYEKFKQALAEVSAENEDKTVEEALKELDENPIKLEECLDNN